MAVKQTKLDPEAIVAKLAGGGELTLDESGVLAEIGWDIRKTDREVSRHKEIVRLQEIAGTSKDREQAQQTAAEAADRLAAEGPVLQEKIATLTESLTALQNVAATCERVVERQTAAVESLRGLAPESVRGQAAVRRSFVDSKYHPHLAPIESEIAVVESLKGVRTNTQDGSRQAVLHAEATRRTDLLDSRGDVNPEWWDAYVSDRVLRLAELRERLAELQAKRAAEMAEANAPLNLYAR